MNNKILACIDHSSFNVGVCDFAVWAAQQLTAPLEFAHVLVNASDHSHHNDFSGSIGLGEQEDLLEQLFSLDEHRNTIALEGGRRLLDDIRQRALSAGAVAQNTHTQQWHGEFVETLIDLQSDVQLFVLGQSGQSVDRATQHLGSNLERAIRALEHPILVVPKLFHTPRKLLIAFDASATTKKCVEIVATSPLFRGLDCHVVMVSADTASHHQNLAWARTILEKKGLVVTIALLQGDTEQVLTAYVNENDIDLLIMGAYGHSRIRQLLVGSTTTTLLKTSKIPVLLLR